MAVQHTDRFKAAIRTMRGKVGSETTRIYDGYTYRVCELYDDTAGEIVTITPLDALRFACWGTVIEELFLDCLTILARENSIPLSVSIWAAGTICQWPTTPDQQYEIALLQSVDRWLSDKAGDEVIAAFERAAASTAEIGTYHRDRLQVAVSCPPARGLMTTTPAPDAWSILGRE